MKLWTLILLATAMMVSTVSQAEQTVLCGHLKKTYRLVNSPTDMPVMTRVIFKIDDVTVHSDSIGIYQQFRELSGRIVCAKGNLSEGTLEVAAIELSENP